MGTEIDLLANYPRSPRDVSRRRAERTAEDRRIASRFGRDFFDGARCHGYGGYAYHPRFFGPVIPAFVERYGLTANSRVLDVGCAKGFFLYELQRAIPGIEVVGVDVSPYAISHRHDDLRAPMLVADARELPFPSDSFDLVVSITTVHNLSGAALDSALAEIERTSRGSSFVTVDAWRTEQERQAIEGWALTAETVLSVEEWRTRFKSAGFHGDYYWFMP